jgi:HEAT repeat protein
MNRRFGMTVAVLLSLCFPRALWAEDPNIEELRQKLQSTDYETRKSAVATLREIGESRPLKKEECDVLLPNFKSDSDWRIKVRIASVLTAAKKAEWVLDALIAALKDTDDTNSGGGNVPASASKSLAQLGDARALKPMREWLKYLESHPDVYPNLRDRLVKDAKKDISDLKEKLANTKEEKQQKEESREGKSISEMSWRETIDGLNP